MSVVAELEVPASEFALGHALAAVPEVDVEFERIVTHSQEWIMPFLWVRADESATLRAFEAEVARDPTVVNATIADRFDDVLLYRIEWCEETREIVNGIFDRAGTLVEATGNDETWNVVVRFDGQHSLSELQEHFSGHDTGFTVQRVYTPSRPRQSEFGLSPEQRDALVTAVERGYFEVPRGTRLADVADDLGVSTTAASERLRRGITALVGHTLTVEDGGSGEEP